MGKGSQEQLKISTVHSKKQYVVLYINKPEVDEL